MEEKALCSQSHAFMPPVGAITDEAKLQQQTVSWGNIKKQHKTHTKDETIMHSPSGGMGSGNRNARPAGGMVRQSFVGVIPGRAKGKVEQSHVAWSLAGSKRPAN